MKLKSFFLFFCILPFIFSCEEKEGKVNGTLELSFHHSNSSNQRVASAPVASAVIVSIEDASGQSVFNKKRLDLYKFDDSYISEPLAITTGSYKLTEFLVLDADNNVIFASPIEGAKLGYIVDFPLPLSFNIVKDQSTKITPQVISTESANPDDFGYSTFSFDLIETFDFLVGVFVYDGSSDNFELTNASLKVTSDGHTLYDHSVADSTNIIKVKDGYSSYNITVSKEGYESYSKDFSVSDLKNYSSEPLVIMLFSNLSLDSGLVAHYPFEHNTKDTSSYGNDAIDYSHDFFQTGVHGSALSFNGYDDYLKLESTLAAENGLSFSFWVKSYGSVMGNNNGMIISKYSITNGRSFNIGTFGYGSDTTTNKIHAHFYNSPSSTFPQDWVESNLSSQYILSKGYDPNYWNLPNAQEIALSQWYHCVINMTNDHLDLYLNGELVVGKEREYTNYASSTTEPTYIGNMFNGADGSNNHFSGLLDELRIYNRSLTSEEIQALYFKGL